MKHNVPPAGTIESAVDGLKSADANLLADQKRELCIALGDKVDQLTCIDGYNLGLQVARLMIAGYLGLPLDKKIADVDPGDIL